ncbi:SRPBCC family protein [Streptomyces albidochromogenes]|uniref:SRPBCC family protein n=1 Tax=Streptomyces albidochromogenes TaxID=329524 RepID=A0ABW6FTT5_9ACTN
MTDTKKTGLAGDAGDRLKEELQRYLQARAERAVAGLGERLGEATKQLADPAGSVGGTLGTLAKGGKQLSEGKSPARVAGGMGLKHMAGGLKDKVKGLFGGGKGETRTKSVVIIEDITVGVPVRQAYDQWTQFQHFGRFAKGAVNVERSDDVNSNWQVKVAKANRSWKAKVTEQVPDERISWTSEGAKGTTKGAVTFHPLGDRLTKVLVVVEYFPKGLVEKTGNIWRAQGRRLRLDLKLFRKFVTMQDEPADGWRGEIRDSEVVRTHEEAEEAEEAEKKEEDEGDEDDDGHRDEESEDEDEGGDEDEDETDGEGQDGHWDEGEDEDWEDEEESEDEPAKARDEDRDEGPDDEEPYDEEEEPYEEESPSRRTAGRR